jgi:hypothetical protein
MIITVSVVTLFMNWYNDRFLPLLWQFLLIPYRTNEFVYLRTNVSPSTLISTQGFVTFQPL